MRISRVDWYSLVLLLIISLLTVYDFFVNRGLAATMDGLVHVTTIMQFTHAFQSGDFPVVWLNDFANYGLPIGIFAHQLPTYAGMVFTLLTGDPVLSFNLLSFIGIVGSNILFYIFLRQYFPPLYAFTGTFLFAFAPYRIINLYIRGAIPETFSTIFLPMILIGIYYLVYRKNIFAYFLLIIAFVGLTLTHPMMLVIYTFLFVPYFLFCLWDTHRGSFTSFVKNRSVLLSIILFFSAICLALGMTSYYIVPLNLEVKYLNYASGLYTFSPESFLNLKNFIDPNWYYFYQGDIFTRGHLIKVGILETIILLSGIVSLLYIHFTKKKGNPISLLYYTVPVSLLLLFFLLPVSRSFYQFIPFLGTIQFPWRLLSAFIFLPPIILAVFLMRINRTWIIVVIVLLISIMSFPQLYGKNYTNVPHSMYRFTSVNLHSNTLNTIWIGETHQYPVKEKQAEIIGGEGEIVSSELKNSYRKYQIDAKNQVQVMDNTFYFPGWKVYVDGVDTPIEFQDMNHRGVITYRVPEGNHEVIVKFEDTKIRSYSKIASVLFFFVFILMYLFRKQLQRMLK